MARRGRRQIVFVCIGVDLLTSNFISKIIPASSTDEASSLFVEITKGIKAKEIHGPFYKKRAQIVENTRTLKFSDKTNKAEYGEWLVNAMILKEPENYAYLVFIKRLDEKKLPPPKGTIIVPISDLRIL